MHASLEKHLGHVAPQVPPLHLCPNSLWTVDEEEEDDLTIAGAQSMPHLAQLGRGWGGGLGCVCAWEEEGGLLSGEGPVRKTAVKGRCV